MNPIFNLVILNDLILAIAKLNLPYPLLLFHKLFCFQQEHLILRLHRKLSHLNELGALFVVDCRYFVWLARGKNIFHKFIQANRDQKPYARKRLHLKFVDIDIPHYHLTGT